MSHSLENGVVYGYYFTNMVVGKIYRLDFVYQNYCIIPDNDIFEGVPGVAVDNIYIRCDGNSPIRYSLNAENASIMKGGVITQGIERKWDTDLKIIKSINFQLYGSGELTSKIAIEVGV